MPDLIYGGWHDLPSRNQRSRDKLEGLGINTGVKVFADGRHGCWNRSPWLEQMVGDASIFPAKSLSQLGPRISAQVLAIIRSFSRRLLNVKFERIDLFISPFASEALSRYPLGLLELTVTLSYFT